MPAPELLLTFLVAAVLIILAPGPSVLFVISRALAYGRRVAITTAAGGAAGTFVLAAAVAAGVGAVVQASAVAYTTIKLAGAGYLVYLGVQAIRHRRALREAFEQATAGPLSDRRTWWEGFVVGVTNPKTAVFLAAVLPQFVTPTSAPPGLQMLLLGAVFAGIALVSDTGYAILAGAARAWFARSARRLELVGGVAGLTMVGLGVGLAVTGRKD